MKAAPTTLRQHSNMTWETTCMRQKEGTKSVCKRAGEIGWGELCVLYHTPTLPKVMVAIQYTTCVRWTNIPLQATTHKLWSFAHATHCIYLHYYIWEEVYTWHCVCALKKKKPEHGFEKKWGVWENFRVFSPFLRQINPLYADMAGRIFVRPFFLQKAYSHTWKNATRRKVCLKK